MPRFKMQSDGATKVWLSERDTYNWAYQRHWPIGFGPRGKYFVPRGGVWTGSQLADRRVFAEFDARGDLIDMAIDGGRGTQDVDVNEFNAIMEDFITARFGAEHPCNSWFHLPRSAGYR